MNLKLFVNMERRAFYVLLISVITVLWWVSVWGTFEGFIDDITEKYGICKRTQYLFVIGVIILFIALHPEILDKL